MAETVPVRAWVVTFAGMTVNLCLGILYAWSVWKAKLVGTTERPPGSPMSGLDEGWTYLTDAQATWAYSLCGFIFALSMIPGGKIQDRFGPRLTAILGGVFLSSGCILASLLKSYIGLILGFGVLGGIGMGLGYASATPAAVKWFGPHRRGLIVGIVVAGFGGAALYISPLASYLVEQYGLSNSFLYLGLFFSITITVAGALLSWPPSGYVAPAPVQPLPVATQTRDNWTSSEMLRSWQFYALVFVFFGSAQSGLLVIANAAPMLNKTAKSIAFFAANAWLLSSFGGLVNATGRVGTGLYSDRIGRANAYCLNGLIAVVALLLTPWVMQTGNVVLLFTVVGVAFWQYGGGLSLLPAFTADYFGPKNLGLNYGLVFLGWGLAFFVPQLAGIWKDYAGNLDLAFYISASLLAIAVLLVRYLRPPVLVCSS